MVKCSFCGKEEDSFKGTHLVRNDGVVDYYCCSKCQKNANKLKRDKRKIRWAEAFHITREKAKVKEEEKKVKESEKAKAKEDQKKKDLEKKEKRKAKKEAKKKKK